MKKIREWVKTCFKQGWWEKYITLLLFVMLAGVFYFRSDVFLSSFSLKQVILGNTSLLIVVFGVSYVMIAGGIDLSVGYQISLVSVAIAVLSMRSLPGWLVIAGALTVGVLCGLLNGILVAFLDIVPFAATIATQIIFRGISYYISNGRMVSNISVIVREIAKWELFRIRGDLWLAILALALFGVIMHGSFVGTYMRAIGLHEESAKRAGIRVRMVKCFTYCLAGLHYAVAGIVLTSIRGYAGSEIGVGMEITGIAAAYIGGILSQAESQSVLTLIFGVLLIGAIESGLPKVEGLSYIKYIIMGLLLIVAMGIHRKRR